MFCGVCVSTKDKRSQKLKLNLIFCSRLCIKEMDTATSLAYCWRTENAMTMNIAASDSPFQALSNGMCFVVFESQLRSHEAKK